jgi:hypothetical protein
MIFFYYLKYGIEKKGEGVYNTDVGKYNNGKWNYTNTIIE